MIRQNFTLGHHADIQGIQIFFRLSPELDYMFNTARLGTELYYASSFCQSGAVGYTARPAFDFYFINNTSISFFKKLVGRLAPTMACTLMPHIRIQTFYW